MNNSEINYQEILNELQIEKEKYPYDKKLWSRPNQELKQHIKNMQTEYKKHKTMEYINKEIMPEWLIEDFIMILIALHDFGKISPVFQWKVFHVKKAPPKLVNLSYHTETSAIFAWLYLSEYIKLNIDEEIDYLKNNLKCNQEEAENKANKIMNFYASIIVISILNHHNPLFPNEPYNQLYSNNIYHTIQLIKYVYTNYPYLIENYFNSILQLEGSTQNKNNINIFSIALKQLYELIEINTLEFDLNFLNNIDNIKSIESIAESVENAWRYHENSYFQIIFLHSILIDLDEWDAKSQIDNTNNHWIDFDWDHQTHINKNIVHIYKSNKWKNNKKLTIINRLRNDLFTKTNASVNEVNRLYVVHAPTGSGKTLAMLNMAVKLASKHYEKYKIHPRIYYVLPFISITDQVGKQISEIINTDLNIQTPALTIHHHLASTQWSYFSDNTINSYNDDQEKNETEFYGSSIKINLWHSEIIVTTYVGMWNTLITSSKRKMIRSHRISNSIIIFDEVQGFPTKYWELIAYSLKLLIKYSNNTIILGSATQPKKLVDGINYIDATKNLDNNLVSKINRYSINYSSKVIELDEFVQIIKNTLKKKLKSTLIVVNTKNSAREIFDQLDDYDNNTKFLLSTHVRPIDRIDIIENIKIKLKNKKKVILVATQVVEAGVDLSFELIYRDFAPLDSIIQVAGRCNRGFEYEQGNIYIYHIKKNNAKLANRVYDKVLLDVTEQILKKKEKWNELDIFKQSKLFFNCVANRKIINKGIEELKNVEIKNLDNIFNLINTYPTVSIAIINSKEYDKIINKKIKQSQIFKEYQKYIIELSSKNKKLLENKLKLQSRKLFSITIDHKSNEKLYFLKLMDEDTIYQKNGGLSVL